MRKTVAGNHRVARLKILALLIFLALGFLLFRFSSLREYFTPQVLQVFLERAGFWGPVAFIFFYAAGVCLFVPGTILTGLGAAIFGPYLGFALVWCGAMIGAVAAFWIGRTLGRDFAASMVGQKLAKYDEAIELNGFAAVLYLRLIYFPFTLMNFGMGLTRVRFLDYFLGTALGIIVGTFIFTFLIGNLREIWAAGDWGQLFSGKFFFSIALFVLSLFLPKAIKKIRGER